MDQLKVVAFNDSFIQELIEVYRDAYRGLEMYAETDDRSIKGYILWLVRQDPEGVFVALLDGKPVGMIGVTAGWMSYRERKEVGEIHEIVVRSDLKRMGVGKALMDAAINYLKKEGLDTFGLWVGKTNESAMRFYETLGFKNVSEGGMWVRMVKYRD
ncbi:MAG TPA: GNAT family N-acetyltransferase [Thermodesulfobacteriota bacterium]|nr:GNAT family N-acetyltransferase [Thermodesulfobacteriota bacterium]